MNTEEINRHLTDFDFLKRKQTFNTTHGGLEKSVYISWKEITSSWSELLLESCNKNWEMDLYMFVV